MVALGDRAACGCGDESIRVWSTEIWALERTLQGHTGYVLGMAVVTVSRRRLIRNAMDGTVPPVLVWSTETWECVQTVEAYPAGLRHSIWSLAVCCTTIVCWSYNVRTAQLGNGTHRERRDVRVCDLETGSTADARTSSGL
jgi:WD40 repeat protein